MLSLDSIKGDTPNAKEAHVNQQIVDAIRGRRIVEFDYGGHHRIAEVHVYGLHRGVDQLLIYQVAGGSSSGGIPQWRRVDVPRISGLNILADVFPGLRSNPSGEHSKWDQVYEIVS